MSLKGENKKPLIGIIGGTGRMGNWFKIFFEKNGLEVLISGRHTKLTNKELARQADIIIVSTPLHETVKVIKEIRNYVRKSALLTDVASLKESILKEMSRTSSACLGMHPLFGPMVPDLNNQTIVFCPGKKNQWVGFLKKVFEKNGAKVIEMKAAEHDEQMALIQALLSFINLNYAELITSRKDLSSGLMTPVFKLQSLIIGRMLSQDPFLYPAIQAENPYFLKIVKEYEKKIFQTKKLATKKDYKNYARKITKLKKEFGDFSKIAQDKTGQILKLIEKEPVKIEKVKRLNLKNASIGYLGPEGTFSWQAAKDIFGESRIKALANIKEVFNKTVSKEVELGIVPIENSIGGLVSESVNAFLDTNVFALGSFKEHISHCLASRGKDLKNIKVIKTHPQPLLQCRQWLANNLPSALQESTSSTIAPVKEDLSKTTGFILSYETAKKFKLNILAREIEDTKDNFTKFLIIAKDYQNKICTSFDGGHIGITKTLLVVSAYDRPGVLRDILNVFADKKINLSALHSIPTPSRPWDYMFFLEVDKAYQSKEIDVILKQLEEYCPYIRAIGSA